jgi:hypothetical protein
MLFSAILDLWFLIKVSSFYLIIYNISSWKIVILLKTFLIFIFILLAYLLLKQNTRQHNWSGIISRLNIISDVSQRQDTQRQEKFEKTIRRHSSCLYSWIVTYKMKTQICLISVYYHCSVNTVLHISDNKLKLSKNSNPADQGHNIGGQVCFWMSHVCMSVCMSVCNQVVKWGGRTSIYNTC